MKNNYDTTVRNFGAVRVFTLIFALFPLFIFGCSSKFQAAGALYEKAGALYEKADALYEKKDYKEAIVKYEEANVIYEALIRKHKALIRQYPDSEWADDAQMWIGMCYYRLNNYDASRRAFIDLLDDFPNSELKGDAQYSIGQLFYNERKFEEAYQEFKKFSTQEFKNYPNFQAEAKYRAASCCLHLPNKSDEALKLLNELIKQFPKSEWVDDALLLVGRVNFYQGDFEKALNAYESILVWNSESDLAVYAKIGIANSLFGIANSLFDLEAKDRSDKSEKIDRWDKAIEQCNKAIGAYERIIKDHKKAADVIPKCSYQIAEVYYKLATEHREKGKKERASEHFEKALGQYEKTREKFPKDEITFYVLQGMIWVLKDLERKDEAEVLIFEHDTGDTGPTAISNAVSQDDLIGFSYFNLALKEENHLKDYEKALQNYGEAIDYVKRPFIKAQCYYRRGLIYQNKLNPPNHEKTLEAFNTLISEYSDSKDPNVASVVADAKILRSELLGWTISEEEKRELIDQKTLVSTVRLEVKYAKGNQSSSGSGFFVAPNQIATNYHVVKTAIAVSASGEENTKYDIQGYTAVDVKSDLIILRVSEKHLSPPELVLGNSDGVKRTNPVYAVGTPLGLGYFKGTRTPGVISNILRDNNGNIQRFLMTAPISPGNSGGPVLNDNGEVVGVTTASYLSIDTEWKINQAQNLNLAIPSNNLEALRQQIGPPKPLWQLHPLWQLEVSK